MSPDSSNEYHTLLSMSIGCGTANPKLMGNQINRFLLSLWCKGRPLLEMGGARQANVI